MLFSANAVGQRSPLQLTGFAGGNASIEQLQVALTGLSRVLGRPAANPGIVTGTVNDATMRALMSTMDVLAAHMPAASYAAVQDAFQLGMSSSQARTTIAQNASALTMAIRGCVAQYSTHMQPLGRAPIQFLGTRGMGAPPIGLLGTSWYRSPGIIVMLLGGLLVGWKLLGGSK